MATHDDEMGRADSANLTHRLSIDSNAQFAVHVGQSQYSDNGGASSCGIAAFNAARIVLGMEQSGIRGDKLISKILTEETMEVSQMYQLGTSSDNVRNAAGDSGSVLIVDERQSPRCRNHLQDTDFQPSIGASCPGDRGHDRT